jgi:hypothetical protein
LKTETRLKGMETYLRNHGEGRFDPIRFENRDPLKGDGNYHHPAISSNLPPSLKTETRLKGMETGEQRLQGHRPDEPSLKTETRLKGMETQARSTLPAAPTGSTLKTETRLKGMETRRYPQRLDSTRPIGRCFENRDPLKGDGNIIRPSFWRRNPS